MNNTVLPMATHITYGGMLIPCRDCAEPAVVVVYPSSHLRSIYGLCDEHGPTADVEP